MVSLKATILFFSVSVHASVVLLPNNWTFDDRIASFGGDISSDGFKGSLIPLQFLSHDPLGCTPFSPPESASLPKNFIPLILRGSCSFFDKVYSMQSSNASLVIIGNNIPNSNLITMYSPGDTSNVTIPSVFVSKETFDTLVEFYKDARKSREIVGTSAADTIRLGEYPNSSANLNPDNEIFSIPVVVSQDDSTIPLLQILSITILIPVLLMLFLYFVYEFIKVYNELTETAPEFIVKQLETRVVGNGNGVCEGDECIICLDEFKNGVKVKVLPCKHEFHVECIDRWLLHQKKTCPMCKREIGSQNKIVPLLLVLSTFGILFSRCFAWIDFRRRRRRGSSGDESSLGDENSEEGDEESDARNARNIDVRVDDANAEGSETIPLLFAVDSGKDDDEEEGDDEKVEEVAQGQSSSSR
ncbi:hypothetical protein HK098_002264 [Nowakowskiella sp. JEL0407]|nr:hypothetical protein HK098_002264 [Nowakowskiella sp. JEL0407]